MNNEDYVSRQFADQGLREQQNSRMGHVLGWALSVVAVIVIAGYFTQTYWTPYVHF
ncbi:MAG TPA: hypothetical protein VK629_20895 [Steroidobacteraceae bacterium]|nr:hypothetical protein [Steroidobacteraceae bacterium]